MTEGQPFLYHVLTALLGAEGALGFPTLALLLYLHFLPLVTWFPLVLLGAIPARMSQCNQLWALRQQHACVHPPLFFCHSLLWFHPEITLTTLAESSGWPLLWDIGWVSGGNQQINQVQKGPLLLPIPLKLFRAYSQSLENFLRLTLHTDSDKTKCSDTWRGRWVCNLVIPFRVFCLSFPSFCKAFLPAEVCNVTLTPSHSPSLYFA